MPSHNVNVHGTAFAGVTSALTWGMMHLQLALNTLDASIVIASGQINYAKPVAQDIRVRCSFGDHVAEMEKLRAGTRATPNHVLLATAT